jgi:hypothetical protein
MTYTRAERRRLAADNRQYSEALALIPREKWMPIRLPPGIKEVWRSRDYLVQIYDDPQNGFERVTISRTFFDPKMDSWGGIISWEDMQRLKVECGRGDKTAVEVYPAEADVVNVANMRHLWILETPPPFVWKKPHGAASPQGLFPKPDTEDQP